MDGGFHDSPLRLNKGLGAFETWNAEEIEARADRLSKEAVVIWPRPALSDDVLAEFQAQGPDAGFSIEDHPNLLAPPRRPLFEKFSTEVLALDPGVTRHFLKLYVAFKAETNFVDIVPQKARRRLRLNIPIETLHDERALAWDVSGKGHWGNGPSEVGLSEDDDFSYAIGLVRQAFEYQIGGRLTSFDGWALPRTCRSYQPTDLNLQNAGSEVHFVHDPPLAAHHIDRARPGPSPRRASPPGLRAAVAA